MSDLQQALAQAYAPLAGVAALMRRAFGGEDISPLAQTLIARAQAHPDDGNAFMDCANVLILTGHHDVGLAVQAQALQIQQLYVLPAPQEKLRLLVLMGPGDLMANTPIEFLLENSDITLVMLYLCPDAPWPETVPEHDVMMVGVAESDANQPLLQAISRYIANWPRPVINHPDKIAVLSRDGVCAALQGIPEIEMPVTRRVERAWLEELAQHPGILGAMLPGDDFPIIVRPLDSHAGTNLEKIGHAGELKSYLEKVTAAQFYLARFVDYSSADGLFRKYRVTMIEGVPYLCHMAISSHWMVHYLNAGMNESAEKRAEEAANMADFEQQFAARHAAAFAAIYRRMQLPYLGMDCAETRDGKLLVFESDNAMVVHALDPVDKYPYKKPAMQKVFDAFHRMLDKAHASAQHTNHNAN
jgi:glutathione synthase/RimK-type ligase-like ATP-grasp enzyme